VFEIFVVDISTTYKLRVRGYIFIVHKTTKRNTANKVEEKINQKLKKINHNSKPTIKHQAQQST
jgi:hypothetical protein